MPNLTRVSRGSICLSSLRRRPSFSLPRRAVIPSSPLSLSLSRSFKVRCTLLSLPPARAPRAFIMHAKFHAEALRLASNPLITRCLRAPARASAHTGMHNARPHTRGRVCARRVRCARLYLKASERAPAAALLVLSLCAPPRPASSLSPAAYLRSGPSLPLFNSFPLSLSLSHPSLSFSLSLLLSRARDG